MEEPSSKGILAKIGVAILVLALVDLFYLNYWVVKSTKLKVESEKLDSGREVGTRPSPSTVASIDSTSANLPILSPSPTQQPAGTSTTTTAKAEKEVQTVVQTAQKEIFIPIGSGSTKSGEFVDLSGLEVTIDTTKYSAIESVVFEASLYTDGGNGRAWAKLKNISDKNPFIESQISSSSGTGEVKTSGNIPMPTGSKKYGVQAKTDLVDYAAHVENARIKITLK